MKQKNRASDGRQRRQHPAGDAAMRGDDPHLPFDLEALADDRRQVVEHLRQVSARFPLRQHGRHEEPRIQRAESARRSSSERLRQRQPEVLLIVQQSGTPARSAPASPRPPWTGRSSAHGRRAARATAGRSPLGTAPRICSIRLVARRARTKPIRHAAPRSRAARPATSDELQERDRQRERQRRGCRPRRAGRCRRVTFSPDCCDRPLRAAGPRCAARTSSRSSTPRSLSRSGVASAARRHFATWPTSADACANRRFLRHLGAHDEQPVQPEDDAENQAERGEQQST